MMLFAKIEEYRTKIDEVDQKLVALLNERAGYSLDIRALKPSAHMGLYDPKREEKFSSVLRLTMTDLCTTKTLIEIYRGILKVMKEVPSRDQ